MPAVLIESLDMPVKFMSWSHMLLVTVMVSRWLCLRLECITDWEQSSALYAECVKEITQPDGINILSYSQLIPPATEPLPQGQLVTLPKVPKRAQCLLVNYQSQRATMIYMLDRCNSLKWAQKRCLPRALAKLSSQIRRVQHPSLCPADDSPRTCACRRKCNGGPALRK